MKSPFRQPEPDFEGLERILRGQASPERMRFVELGIDPEIMKAVSEGCFGIDWIPYSREERERFWDQLIAFWHRAGYDYIRVTGAGEVSLNWQRLLRSAEDTADALSRGTRHWVEEGQGVIGSREDFERYPWPRPEDIDYAPYEYIAAHLPDGMQMMVCPSDGVFEVVSESLLGLEGLCYLLVDDRELVAATFRRVADIIAAFYETVVQIDRVGGFFQGDDMGHKTATLISPDDLREFVLPAHKRFAEIAHEHGKMYWLHSCGALEAVLEDLIEDVRVDAVHSFQEVILPVSEFVARYGDRVAALGGIDVDRLSRLPEDELRAYIRGVIGACMPGRYALGSGNSVANYVPVENYLVMIEEGLAWRP